jgi:hypothetical protein
MELTWETVIRLAWPLVADITNIPLRVAPVVFDPEVNFMVAVPPVPSDWLSCNQEEAGLSILHWELQVMVIMESAPWAGKSIPDTDTDNWGGTSGFFLHPKEKTVAISIPNNV